MDDVIIHLIKQLDPSISIKYADDTIQLFIDISKALVDKDIPDDKKNIAIALITLDMLSTPERSNTTSKTISGVSISYSTGASTSKWRKMYDDMLNGMITSDISIYYVGI